MAQSYPTMHPDLPTDRKHRFVEVNAESSKMLLPIYGYNKAPLLSVEEAVEGLADGIIFLNAHLRAVQVRVAALTDHLSKDESAAIMLYTIEWNNYQDSLYYTLNVALRTENRAILKKWFPYLKLLLTALARVPSRSLKIYRGVRFVNALDFQTYKVGAEIIWWGFSSCSVTRDICERREFIGDTGMRVLFIIACTDGKDIGVHSYFSNEREILLLPATKVKVVKTETNDEGLYIVYLQQLPTPEGFLEPISLTEKPMSRAQSKKKPSTTGSDPGSDCKLTETVYLKSKRYRKDDFYNEVVNRYIHNNHCRQLFLQDSELTVEHARALSHGLSGTGKVLELLDLSKNQLGDKGVEVLADALSDHGESTLRELSLISNGITHVGAANLALMLETNKTLTHLWLAQNNLSDDGIQKLVRALTNKNRTLQELSLAWNNFHSSATTDAIIKMLESNTTLATLSLTGCKLSSADLRRLKDAAAKRANFKLIL